MKLLLLLIGEFLLLLILSYIILNSLVSKENQGRVTLFISFLISISSTLMTWGILA